jgi:hypothetical protein
MTKDLRPCETFSLPCSMTRIQPSVPTVPAPPLSTGNRMRTAEHHTPSTMRQDIQHRCWRANRSQPAFGQRNRARYADRPWPHLVARVPSKRLYCCCSPRSLQPPIRPSCIHLRARARHGRSSFSVSEIDGVGRKKAANPRSSARMTACESAVLAVAILSTSFPSLVDP